MECNNVAHVNFLENVVLGGALAVPFMFTSNPLGVSLLYSTTALPLHLMGLSPAVPIGIGIGCVGRAFHNITPLTEFFRKGESFLSHFSSSLEQPLLKPAVQFLGGVGIAKFGIEWARSRSFKDTYTALHTNARKYITVEKLD